MLKKIYILLAAFLIAAAGLSGCSAEKSTVDVPKPAAGMTMQGYVSRYHPSHISSAEAWDIIESDSLAVILDVRSEESYTERHVLGAIHVPFETMEDYAAGSLPQKDQTIICYCFCDDKGGSALSACELLTSLGYLNVYYTEPEDEWVYEGSFETPDIDDSQHKIVSGKKAKEIYDYASGAILLDVRNRDEYDSGHIDGSVLIPLLELESRLSELKSKDAAIIVYCKSGGRSKSACEMLALAGYKDVYDMQKVDNWPEPLVTE